MINWVSLRTNIEHRTQKSEHILDAVRRALCLEREMSDDANLNGTLDSRFLMAQNTITGKFVIFPSEEIGRSEMVSNRTLPLHCGIVHRDHHKGLEDGSIEIVSSKTMKMMSLVLAMGKKHCPMNIHWYWPWAGTSCFSMSFLGSPSMYLPLPGRNGLSQQDSPWVSKLRTISFAVPGAASAVPTIAHGWKAMTRMASSTGPHRRVHG